MQKTYTIDPYFVPAPTNNVIIIRIIFELSSAQPREGTKKKRLQKEKKEQKTAT